MITARFSMAEHPTTVHWIRGTLTGDAGTISYLQEAARIREGREVGLPGLTTTTTNHLANGRSFMALCALAADAYPTFTVTGDEPDLIPIPLPPGVMA